MSPIAIAERADALAHLIKTHESLPDLDWHLSSNLIEGRATGDSDFEASMKVLAYSAEFMTDFASLTAVAGRAGRAGTVLEFDGFTFVVVAVLYGRGAAA
jgi:hypothetical protein